MIAPLEASCPYKAAAAAPFKTVILSISFGLISPAAVPPPLTGIPSTINKGSLLCPGLIEDMARIIIGELALGEPPVLLV